MRTNFVFYALLIIALGLSGCVMQPPGPADEFFTDPHALALAQALRRNDWAGAQRAIQAGANPNTIGNEGMYPLIWTMYLKNKAAFEWLLNHGADPNISSRSSLHNEDLSVLMFAAQVEDPDWLRMLLSHRTDPNRTYKTGIGTMEPPLLATMIPHRLTQLKMLIAAGADINNQNPDNRATPSREAAGVGFFEGVYALIDAGADIRPHDAGGRDVTYEVARHRLALSAESASWRDKVLLQLRQRGADVDGALREVQAAEEKDRRDYPWRYHQ